MASMGAPHDGPAEVDPISAILNAAAEDEDGGLDRMAHLLYLCGQAGNLINIVVPPADAAELERHERYLRRLERAQDFDAEEVRRAVPDAIALVRRVVADCGITVNELHLVEELDGTSDED